MVGTRLLVRQAPEHLGTGREQAPRCLGETQGKDFFPKGKWWEEGRPQGALGSRVLKERPEFREWACRTDSVTRGGILQRNELISRTHRV